MEKHVSTSEFVIIDNMVVITEKTQTKLGTAQLESKLNDLTRYKEKVKEEQERLYDECNKIDSDIKDTKEMLQQLNKNI